MGVIPAPASGALCRPSADPHRTAHMRQFAGTVVGEGTGRERGSDVRRHTGSPRPEHATVVATPLPAGRPRQPAPGPGASPRGRGSTRRSSPPRRTPIHGAAHPPGPRSGRWRPDRRGRGRHPEHRGRHRSAVHPVRRGRGSPPSGPPTWTTANSAPSFRPPPSSVTIRPTGVPSSASYAPGRANRSDRQTSFVPVSSGVPRRAYASPPRETIHGTAAKVSTLFTTVGAPQSPRRVG